LRQSHKNGENLFDTLIGVEPGFILLDECQENAYLCFEDFLMCSCWSLRISGNF